jgi:N-acetylmuramoyl-L-alanine amidase
LRLVERPSANRDTRPADAAIDMLVVHYTGMRSAAEALDRLCDPAAKVSAHYLIDEDGTVVALVPDELRAWHAGVSWWRGCAGLNDVSIGIELVNPGHEWGYRPFPATQMAALVELAAALVRRWGIPTDRVLGHSDITPTRKDDPGELFDWPLLARAGLCLSVPSAPIIVPDPAAAAAALCWFGYAGAAEGVPLPVALRAFQRRWRPARCDGALDGETMGLTVAVAGLRDEPAGTN